MYTETLGRWHTVDLFVGLAYLSHRETLDYPAAGTQGRTDWCMGALLPWSVGCAEPVRMGWA